MRIAESNMFSPDHRVLHSDGTTQSTYKNGENPSRVHRENEFPDDWGWGMALFWKLTHFTVRKMPKIRFCMWIIMEFSVVSCKANNT